MATHAMGCRFELVLAGAPTRVLRAAGEEAIELIEEAHSTLTRFERGSIVWRLNRGQDQRVDAEVFELFMLCENVRAASLGVFDITRGGVIALDTERRIVRVERGDVDMGAVAKGWAVDRAARWLADAGVPSAFVHGGGSTVRAYGAPPVGENAWSVLIGAETGLDPIHAVITDRALGVSGDGKQGTHIVDARTGRCARSGAFGACIGNSGALCDAWSTVLAVTGARPDAMPEEYQSFVVRDDAWCIEPSIESASKEMAGCQSSIVVRS
ncbi:MAG: hypothetical protein Tsb0013_13920 [Phycisphaerales bacterium]